MSYSLIGLLLYGGLFAWITAAPVIFIHGFNIQPNNFGLLLICTGISTGISGSIGGKLTRYISQAKILLLGLLLMITAGVGLLLLDKFVGLNIYSIIIAAMIFIFGSTFGFLTCFSLGFHQVGEIAGYAGSLYSCIQLLGGFIFSALLGHISTSSPQPMAWMFVLSAVLSLVVYFYTIFRLSSE